MSRIKAGKRVRVELSNNENSFFGLVTLSASTGKLLNKDQEDVYNVKAEDDGHTYRCIVGKEGCVSITQV